MLVERIAWTPRRGDMDTRPTVLRLRKSSAEQRNRLRASEQSPDPLAPVTHHQTQPVNQDSQVLTRQRPVPYTLLLGGPRRLPAAISKNS
jgi:hypothetical protein